jgi:hypothetical protein
MCFRQNYVFDSLKLRSSIVKYHSAVWRVSKGELYRGQFIVVKDLSSTSMPAIDFLDEVVWEGLVIIEASIVCSVEVIVCLGEHVILVHCVVQWAHSVKE